MSLWHYAPILLIIFVTFNTSHSFADNSTAWKVTIKTPSGVNSTSFWPPEIHARQNETILWINNDTTAHTVTSGVLDHPTYVGKLFDSGTMNPGETYKLKITDQMWSGYYYFCKIHPWMTGKIDVGTAYLGTSPDFNIETDKNSYADGEHVRISGIVNNTGQITPITIQIFDNDRNLVYFGKTSMLADHSFFYEFKASSSIFKTNGGYKIKSMFGFPSTVTDVNIAFSGPQTVNNEENTPHIPHWIKNNANWWKNSQISDADFINGIQYLIKDGYLPIRGSSQSGINTNITPEWIKDGAAKWANGTSSDDEFVADMQYLINHDVIKA